MNPVISPLQAQPRQAFGALNSAQSAVKTGAYPRFGNAKAGAEVAEKLGKWATARAFAKYYVEGENKQALKAMLWEYGIPTGIGLSALLPVVGWSMAIVGIPFALWAASRGAKMRKKLTAEATKGPFLRLNEVKTLYSEATDYKKVTKASQARGFSAKIINKVRDLVDELFPDQDNKQIKNLQKAVNRLKPAADGRAEKLVANALEVQLNYRNKFAGRTLRMLNRTIGKIKFKPIQLPVLVAKSLLIGSLMLMNRGALRQGLKAVA